MPFSCYGLGRLFFSAQFKKFKKNSKITMRQRL